MWTIIIFTTVGFLFGIWSFRKELNDYFDYMDVFVFSLIYATVSGMLGLAVAIVIPTEKEKVIKTYKLESIKDNSSITGNFFLGSGNIDGKMKYCSYIESDGYYTMFTTHVDDSFITYTKESPVVEKHYYVKTDYFLNNFSLTQKKTPVMYVYKIPKGSILNNYNLDAQ